MIRKSAALSGWRQYQIHRQQINRVSQIRHERRTGLCRDIDVASRSDPGTDGQRTNMQTVPASQFLPGYGAWALMDSDAAIIAWKPATQFKVRQTINAGIQRRKCCFFSGTTEPMQQPAVFLLPTG